MSEMNSSLYVVTGASSGIGRTVAINLAKRGFRVVAAARTKELLNSLSEICGPNLLIVAADLSTSAGIDRVVSEVAGVSEIAGVVHAAGSLVPLEPFQQIDSAELVEHFRIHCTAPIALFQALARSYRVERMLFIDSYSATTPRLGWSAYSIVKSAAQMAARCAAQELADTASIRVFPGAVNTQIVDAVLKSNTETAKTFATMLEKGEFAEPEDAAAFIVALLVDASDDLIGSREAWDYNNAMDRAAVSGT